MAVQPINACLPFSHIAGIMALLINKMIDGQANNVSSDGSRRMKHRVNYTPSCHIAVLLA